MRNTTKPRKPQINVEVTADEKELIERVAQERGLKAATLLRTLALDEARRLGISKSAPTPSSSLPAWGEEIGWTDANNQPIKVGDRVCVVIHIPSTEYLKTNHYWIVDNHSNRIGLTPEHGGNMVLFSKEVANYLVIDNPAE